MLVGLLRSRGTTLLVTVLTDHHDVRKGLGLVVPFAHAHKKIIALIAPCILERQVRIRRIQHKMFSYGVTSGLNPDCAQIDGLLYDLLIFICIELEWSYFFETFDTDAGLVIILVTEIAPDDLFINSLNYKGNYTTSYIATLWTNIKGTTIVRQIGWFFEQEPAHGFGILVRHKPAQARYLIANHR